MLKIDAASLRLLSANLHLSLSYTICAFISIFTIVKPEVGYHQHSCDPATSAVTAIALDLPWPRRRVKIHHPCSVDVSPEPHPFREFPHRPPSSGPSTQSGSIGADNSLETAWRAESESLKSILTGAPHSKLGRLALVQAQMVYDRDRWRLAKRRRRVAA
ncbi:Dynamin GTPase [Forsythia ovata]|uniref:Dynamin GTPase n=1 Tax=Forsythia ovata TaxID=205694 RepID=A0ABD1USP7_9LAMI